MSEHYERWKELVELAEALQKLRVKLRSVGIECRNSSLEETERKVMSAALEAYGHPEVQEYITRATEAADYIAGAVKLSGKRKQKGRSCQERR